MSKNVVINVGKSKLLDRSVQELLFKNGYLWAGGFFGYKDCHMAYPATEVGIELGSNKRMSYASMRYWSTGRLPVLNAATEFGKLVELLEQLNDIVLTAGYSVQAGYGVSGDRARVCIKQGEYAQVGCVRATVEQLKEILARVEGK